MEINQTEPNSIRIITSKHKYSNAFVIFRDISKQSGGLAVISTIPQLVPTRYATIKNVGDVTTKFKPLICVIRDSNFMFFRVQSITYTNPNYKIKRSIRLDDKKIDYDTVRLANEMCDIMNKSNGVMTVDLDLDEIYDDDLNKQGRYGNCDEDEPLIFSTSIHDTWNSYVWNVKKREENTENFKVIGEKNSENFKVIGDLDADAGSSFDITIVSDDSHNDTIDKIDDRATNVISTSINSDTKDIYVSSSQNWEPVFQQGMSPWSLPNLNKPESEARKRLSRDIEDYLNLLGFFINKFSNQSDPIFVQMVYNAEGTTFARNDFVNLVLIRVQAMVNKFGIIVAKLGRLNGLDVFWDDINWNLPTSNVITIEELRAASNVLNFFERYMNDLGRFINRYFDPAHPVFSPFTDYISPLVPDENYVPPTTPSWYNGLEDSIRWHLADDINGIGYAIQRLGNKESFSISGLEKEKDSKIRFETLEGLLMDKSVVTSEDNCLLELSDFTFSGTPSTNEYWIEIMTTSLHMLEFAVNHIGKFLNTIDPNQPFFCMQQTYKTASTYDNSARMREGFSFAIDTLAKSIVTMLARRSIVVSYVPIGLNAPTATGLGIRESINAVNIMVNKMGSFVDKYLVYRTSPTYVKLPVQSYAENPEFSQFFVSMQTVLNRLCVPLTNMCNTMTKSPPCPTINSVAGVVNNASSLIKDESVALSSLVQKAPSVVSLNLATVIQDVNLKEDSDFKALTAQIGKIPTATSVQTGLLTQLDANARFDDVLAKIAVLQSLVNSNHNLVIVDLKRNYDAILDISLAITSICSPNPIVNPKSLNDRRLLSSQAPVAADRLHHNFISNPDLNSPPFVPYLSSGVFIGETPSGLRYSTCANIAYTKPYTIIMFSSTMPLPSKLVIKLSITEDFTILIYKNLVASDRSTMLGSVYLANVDLPVPLLA